jgi:hypothetical protein
VNNFLAMSAGAKRCCHENSHKLRTPATNSAESVSTDTRCCKLHSFGISRWLQSRTNAGKNQPVICVWTFGRQPKLGPDSAQSHFIPKVSDPKPRHLTPGRLDSKVCGGITVFTSTSCSSNHLLPEQPWQQGACGCAWCN